MRGYAALSARYIANILSRCARHGKQRSLATRRQAFSRFVNPGSRYAYPVYGRLCAKTGRKVDVVPQLPKGNNYSTAPKKNYYKVLGVSSKATQAQIKDAYYKQSMKHHPDRHKGSEEAHDLFQEITEAYSVLGNHDLRKQYDRGLIVSGDITLDPTPRRPSPSGSIYDFDEWTKQHYSEALKRKQRSMRERADEERERNSHKLRVGSQRWISVSVFIVAVLVPLLVLERKVKKTGEDTVG